VWAKGLAGPRSLAVTPGGEVLVLDRNGQQGRILALWDEDNNGISGHLERAVLVEAPGLNHGAVYQSSLHLPIL